MKSIAMGTRLAAAAALIAGAPAAFANPERWQLNMSPGVTETAHTAYNMHMIMLWICVVIGILVFGAMFFSMWKFRHSKGAVADTSLTHSTRVEVIWTVIPVAILIIMAWPATNNLLYMADTSKAEMTVKVTGYQWKWRYEVIDYKGATQKVGFMSTLDFDSNRTRMLGSGLDPNAVKTGDLNTYLLNVDRPLVVPTNTKIRFLFTADDVIHAWWVPAFGWKQDAIPGFINEAHATVKVAGTYRGQCAELCGKDHGFMPIVVEAVEPAEFEKWLAANTAGASQGQAVAASSAAVAPTKG